MVVRIFAARKELFVCRLSTTISDLPRILILMNSLLFIVYFIIIIIIFLGADVIILMFDITNQKSFYDLDTVWMNLLRHSIYPNAVPCDKCLVVVGNKADLELQRKVTNTHGKDFAEEIGATFIEISAKTGHNVDALLRHCSIACGHPS